MLHVSIQRLPHGKNTPLPAYQSEYAAGMDLHAAPTDGAPIVVPAGEVRLIPCGFSLAVPESYEAQIRPRSGLSTKHRISMPNAPGTIDADYRGEVMVPLINHGDAAFTVEPGMRIAQMLILPVPRVAWNEVDTLPPTARGSGGFGHTGNA
ncbi:MAG: dUTP diphosphatase [Algisphaera sp.]